MNRWVGGWMDGWMDGEGKREMHRYVIKQNEMLIVEPQW